MMGKLAWCDCGKCYRVLVAGTWATNPPSRSGRIAASVDVLDDLAVVAVSAVGSCKLLACSFEPVRALLAAGFVATMVVQCMPVQNSGSAEPSSVVCLFVCLLVCLLFLFL
ncbi:unnamed protein product [Polarella glacialis]|uniref:Uncharacterized protein n=1 Tax=Polarella glacialis TaxID=89957 RepID=A0A813E7S6_POLGL|nr:unnamed protein product [Polarella glacialis]